MSQNLSFGRVVHGHHQVTSSVQLTAFAARRPQLASNLSRKPIASVCQRLRVGAATVAGRLSCRSPKAFRLPCEWQLSRVILKRTAGSIALTNAFKAMHITVPLSSPPDARTGNRELKSGTGAQRDFHRLAGAGDKGNIQPANAGHGRSKRTEILAHCIAAVATAGLGDRGAYTVLKPAGLMESAACRIEYCAIQRGADAFDRDRTN